jgi:hypothetical protein
VEQERRPAARAAAPAAAAREEESGHPADSEPAYFYAQDLKSLAVTGSGITPRPVDDVKCPSKNAWIGKLLGDLAEKMATQNMATGQADSQPPSTAVGLSSARAPIQSELVALAGTPESTLEQLDARMRQRRQDREAELAARTATAASTPGKASPGPPESTAREEPKTAVQQGDLRPDAWGTVPMANRSWSRNQRKAAVKRHKAVLRVGELMRLWVQARRTEGLEEYVFQYPNSADEMGALFGWEKEVGIVKERALDLLFGMRDTRAAGKAGRPIVVRFDWMEDIERRWVRHAKASLDLILGKEEANEDGLGS